MRKICVITGTRADYGIIQPVLEKIKKHPQLKLSLIVAGMHLSHEFGYTIEEIKKDGFKIDAKIDMLLSDDSGGRMAQSVGIGTIEMVQVFEQLKPDIILLHGDREEPFAAAIAGLCLNIPVAHISGGEVATGGHVDEAIRYSITKFAHIHFATSKQSKERIIKLGEDSWRVFNVGSSAIDTILNKKLLSDKEFIKKFPLALSEPIILVIQHPLTIAPQSSAKQMKEIMEAVKELELQTVLIYPNADAGGKNMIEVIKKYEKLPFIRAFRSIPSKDYLSLMQRASVIVGNSSSGIIEAPSFHLPAVDVGERQNGRERAGNIIDVDYNKEQIKKAIHKAVYNKKFKAKVKRCKSPYGRGKASQKTVDILSKIKIDQRLLHKKITY